MGFFSSDKKKSTIVTTQKQPIGQPDEPAVKDEFGIDSYIDGLAEFIEECNTPLTLSIQGAWGTGKTSIMNLVREKLKKDNDEKSERVIPIWFNTWQFSQFNMSDQLPVSLINSLITKLDIKDNNVNELTAKVLKGLRIGYLIGKAAVVGGLDLAGKSNASDMAKNSFSAMEATANALSYNDISRSIESLKKTFADCIITKLREKNIDTEKGRVVVFIDDLDRLNPGKAVELLEVLKLFLDCKNCVFVLAIDYDVVCRGVEIKYGSLADDKTASAEKGKSFFDKIIQVPFKMPIARYKIEKYVTNCFDQIGIKFTNTKELDTYIELIQYSVGTNPRSMKRLFNAFQLLLKIVPKGKIVKPEDKQLLFAVLCLQHCSESIYSFIIRNLDDMSFNMFKLIIDTNYKEFVQLADDTGFDYDELIEDDFQAAQLFMDKLKRAIDLDNNDDIDEKEFDNFKEIMNFSVITNTTDIEKPANRGSQVLDDYTQLNLKGNSTEDVKRIINLIKRMGSDIDIKFIRRKSGEEAIYGKVNGKTMIEIYGLANGYYLFIWVPDEDMLRDADKYPKITGLVQDMRIILKDSYLKAARISVKYNENFTETEEKMVELGTLAYEEWLNWKKK